MRSITVFNTILAGCGVGVLGCEHCPPTGDAGQNLAPHLRGDALSLETQGLHPSRSQGFFAEEIEHLTAPHDEDGAIVRDVSGALPPAATSALISLFGSMVPVPTVVLSLLPSNAAERSTFLSKLESALPTGAANRASLVSEVLQATDRAGVESALSGVFASATRTGGAATMTGSPGNSDNGSKDESGAPRMGTSGLLMAVAGAAVMSGVVRVWS